MSNFIERDGYTAWHLKDFEGNSVLIKKPVRLLSIYEQ